MDLMFYWNHLQNIFRIILNYAFNNIYNFVNLINVLIVLYALHCLIKAFGFTDQLVNLNHTKLVKKMENSNLRPHYPNGWIPVIESIHMRKNRIQSFTAFGRHLIGFRGQSGSVYVLDAYCPHIGAHIGVGGKVTYHLGQECIRCPFHGWTFRGRDGHCVAVPSMPTSELPKARIKVWDSREINGNIFIWYHSEDSKPDWTLQAISEIQKKTWNFEGRTEHHVNCHFQEIPENGPDRGHLDELHSPAVMAGNVLTRNLIGDTLTRVLRHQWTSSWEASRDQRHMAHMDLKVKNMLFDLPLIEIDFEVTQIGPAFVELRYKCNALGGIKGTFIQMVTPLEPNHNKIVHHFYAEPTLKSKLLSKFLIYGELRMIERDIIIWNNKRFLDNPIFSKNEKSLVAFRRWFKQFYAEERLKESEV